MEALCTLYKGSTEQGDHNLYNVASLHTCIKSIKKKKTHTEKIINCECSNRVYYEKHHVSYESNRASNKSITVAGFEAKFCEK
jgi:hypothetical protein